MNKNKNSMMIACVAIMLVAKSVLAMDGTWSNVSDGNWNTSGNWTGGNIASGTGASAYFTNGTGVTVFQDVGSLTLGNLYFANANTMLTNNAIALNNSGSTSTIAVDGSSITAKVNVVLSPATGTTLTKTGSGTLFLNKPAATFSGLTINNGLLLLGLGVGGDGLNVGTNTITINSGATLSYLDNNLINNSAVFDIKSGGILDFGGKSDNIGAITGDGVVTNMSQGQQLWMNGATRTFSGKIFGGGTLQFYQPGVFVVGASNSLENVTFEMTSPGLSLTFAPGIGTFALGGLTITNGFALQDTLGGAINLGLGGLGGTLTYSKPFTGPGGLTKNGTGIITLTNLQTYAATTTVNGGTLKLGDGINDGSVSNTSSITIGPSGTLAFNALANQTYSIPIYGAGTITKAGAGSLAINDLQMRPGTITLNANSSTVAINGGNSSGVTFTVNSGSTLQINGGNYLMGNFTLNTGSNPLSLTGGSSTGATLTVNSGTSIAVSGGTHNFASALGGSSSRYTQTGGTISFVNSSANGNTNVIHAFVSGGTLSLGTVQPSRGLGLLASSNAVVKITNLQRIASDGSSHSLIITNNADVTATTLQFMSSGNSASTGIVVLAGGTLTASGLDNTGGNSNSFIFVYFNGGLLRSSASLTIGANAYSTFNVMEGGARIDTGNWSPNLQQPLVSGVGGTDGGLTKYGSGFLQTSTNNTYTGTTTVNAGTLKATTISGTPFGSGNVLLNGATMQTYPAGSGRTVGLTAADGAAGNTFTYNAGSIVGLSKGSDTSVTLTLGNSGAAANSVLVRTNNSMLAIIPVNGTVAANLGLNEKLLVNGGVPTVNGMVSASIFGVGTGNDRKPCDFLTYGANGFVLPTYTAGLVGGSTSIANVTTNSTVNTTQVYALRVDNGAALAINSGQMLTVGDGTNPAGVILNNSSSTTTALTNGTLNFGTSEGIVIFNMRRSDAYGPILGSRLAGSGGLTLAGGLMTSGGGTDGDLQITSTNNVYTGPTRIMSGRVTLVNNRGFSTGDVYVYGNEGWGGQFQFNFTGTMTNAFHLSGIGVAQTAPAGALRFDANSTLSGPIELMANTRVSAPLWSISGTLLGSITGPAGLEINCPGQTALWGKIILSGANSYTGTTTISGGTLEISPTGTFGTGPIINNGTLSFNRSMTVTNTYSGNGTVILSGAGAVTLANTITNFGSTEVNAGILDLNGQNLSVSALAGTGAISNSAGTGVTLTVGSGNVNSLFRGVIANGAGTVSLNKTGTGTLTLNGANTYSGSTLVSSGTLKLQGVLTAPLTNGLVTQLDASDSSKLTLDGTNVSVWADSSASGVNFTQGLAFLKPVYVTNSINGRSAINFQGFTNRLVASKSTLVQTVFAINRVKGFWNCNGFFGQAGNDLGIRLGSSTSWDNTFWSGGHMFINGVETTAYTMNVPHLMTAMAPTAQNWVTAIGDYWAAPGFYRSYQGDVGEVLVYTNALSTADRQTVEAYLNYKWMGIGSFVTSNVLSTGTALSISNNATFDLNGISQTIGSLAGAGSVANGSAVWSTLTVGNDDSSTLFSGVISSSNTLTKTGSGTLTLGGANTYLGNTLINSGTLTLVGGANRLPTSGTVTVASGATLNLNGQSQTLAVIAGSGSVVGGNLTVTGTVAPGGLNAVGTLTLASTPVLSGSTLLIDTRVNSISDKLTVSAALSLTGLTLQIADTTQLHGYSYEIVNSTGDLTGSFAATPNLPNTWIVRYDRTPGASKVLLVHNLGTIITIR